jgi:predicted transposase YbfD/YdcC
MSKLKRIDLISIFASTPDPRIDRRKAHQHIDIIFITIRAIMCGADTWVDIEAFGLAREPWLKNFLKLPNGIPSHDTFARVFQLLDPNEFQQRFQQWVHTVIDHLPKKTLIAIDGKTIRRSFSKRDKSDPIHLISAWSSQHNISLAQIKTDQTSNEITAIPELLKILCLKGCIVSIDAIGCQKNIAQLICQQNADYLLAVKQNQPALFNDIKLFVDDFLQREPQRFNTFETIEKDHDRIETRKYWITSHTHWLNKNHSWHNLKSIGLVDSIRAINGRSSSQRRFFISSLNPDAKLFAQSVRAHWSIESSCHWSLDISFREDDSRIRKGHSPQNFALIRKLVLSRLKNDFTSVVSQHN